MKTLYFIIIMTFANLGLAQNPKTIMNKVLAKFSRVQDYSAQINMAFDIPNVNMSAVNGLVYYKKPDKFRIKSKGIAFVPKQNPYFSLNLLRDSTSYVAIVNGAETIRNVPCTIINVIPNVPTDMVIGKFWVDVKNSLILKSQITTNNNGTLNIDNYFGVQSSLALPEKMVMTIEMTKFKLPKALSAELNSKSSKYTSKPEKGIGKITMTFSKYQVNKQLSDSIFKK